MAERGVLFSGPMVRALLAGTKTQTRRGIVMPSRRGHSEFGRSDTAGYDWHFRDKGLRWHDLKHERLLELLQHRVGDRLYVREHWRAHSTFDQSAPRDIPESRIFYIADQAYEPQSRFRQGMHMPRWASRLTLTVTEVRVQRLQDCTEGDARAEGVIDTGNPLGRWKNYRPEAYPPGIGFNSAVNSYATLWNSINGEGAWQANPWIAAYTFTLQRGNVDAPA